MWYTVVTQTASGGRPAIFLDRDGVIVVPEFRNGRSYAPTTLDAFEMYSDALEALTALKNAGYVLVVVTNQPDIGNGVLDPAIVEAMHDRLLAALPIDLIVTCPHTRADACECRKPKPGMLLDAAAKLHIALDRSVMIGDRDSDIEAARAAGCRAVFIDLDYEAEPKPRRPDFRVRNLREASLAILSHGAIVDDPRPNANV